MHFVYRVYLCASYDTQTDITSLKKVKTTEPEFVFKEDFTIYVRLICVLFKFNAAHKGFCANCCLYHKQS
jgi:hypothetical protein